MGSHWPRFSDSASEFAHYLCELKESGSNLLVTGMFLMRLQHERHKSCSGKRASGIEFSCFVIRPAGFSRSKNLAVLTSYTRRE